MAVYLYHFFASYSASVGHLHLNSGGVCGVIEGNTLQFLSKRGIAQAISKGVQHILFPGPAAEGGVALIQYTVLVAGLIIFVVLVNAFGIHHIGLRLGGHDFGGVGIAVVAVILHRGGGVGIHSHRFHRAARRRGFACDHIRQAVSAAVASVAQVQDCADFRISLQRSHFGIKVTAEQNHDLARRRFRLGDQGKLLGSQSQAALWHVSALSGGTSDDHKRGIRLCTFGDNVQAVKCKRLLDGRGVGQVRGVHAATAMGQGLHEAAASQHQHSTVLHGQRIVFIFQQDRTLPADLPNQRRFGLILFLQGIVGGFEILGIFFLRPVGLHDAAGFDAQGGIDQRGICARHAAACHSKRREQDEHNRQGTP